MNEDESDDLPEGWARTTVGEVVSELQTGFACGKHNRDDGVPHLRPMNVTGRGEISLTDVKFVPKAEVDREARWLRQVDVLFNNTNSPELVGKTAWYGDAEPRAFSNHMTRLRFPVGIHAQFVAMLLHQRWREGYFACICNNHVSQASVSRTALGEVFLPIPPLAEQRRIVTAVETVLAKVSSARERLERVAATMKRFRQAVLSAACSGRLTADWRTGKMINGYDDLPEGWRRTELRELLERIEAGKSFRCDPRQASSDEWGIVKVSAMTWGEFDETENKSVLPGTEFNPAHEIKPSDVLLSRSNTEELAGATVFVRQTRPKLLLSDKSLRLVPRVGIRPEWLWRVMQSPESRSQLSEMASGTSNSMRNISQEKLVTVQLSLPPMAEQEEIVRRVSALFALADSFERRAASALKRVESLTKAVLAKAFRGELVPTEAELARREKRTYETADELLARIRATPAAVAKPKRARKATG